MEHRHERRLPCRLDVEIYRKGERIGTAEIKNASKSGVNIFSSIELHHNEIVHVIFPDDAVQSGWPAKARAIVTHAESTSAGLLFDDSISGNLPDIQPTVR